MCIRDRRVAARTVVYDWIDERERPELAQDDRTLFGARQPVGTAAPHDAVYALLSIHACRNPAL